MKSYGRDYRQSIRVCSHFGLPISNEDFKSKIQNPKSKIQNCYRSCAASDSTMMARPHEIEERTAVAKPSSQHIAKKRPTDIGACTTGQEKSGKAGCARQSFLYYWEQAALQDSHLTISRIFALSTGLGLLRAL